MKCRKMINAIIRHRAEKPLQDSIPLDEINMTIVDAKCLEGMGYVDKVFIDMSGNCTIRPAPACYCYFEKKAEERQKFIKQFFTNFLAGFLSGIAVTVLTVYVIPALLT